MNIAGNQVLEEISQYGLKKAVVDYLEGYLASQLPQTLAKDERSGTPRAPSRTVYLNFPFHFDILTDEGHRKLWELSPIVSVKPDYIRLVASYCEVARPGRNTRNEAYLEVARKANEVLGIVENAEFRGRAIQLLPETIR